MNRLLCIGVVLVCMSTQIFAGGGKESDPQKQKKATETAVVLDNFNRTTTYTKVPERVIALSLEQAETLAALGLADKIILIEVGHHTFDDVLPEYRDMLKSKPTTGHTSINLEYILSQNPDFIFYKAVKTLNKIKIHSLFFYSGKSRIYFIIKQSFN